MMNQFKIKVILSAILPNFLYRLALGFYKNIFNDDRKLNRKLKARLEFIAFKENSKYSFKIILNPKNGIVDKKIYDESFEKDIVGIIKENLYDGATFVDVGANIGYYTLLAAKIVGNKGNVYSFEPLNFIYKQLKDSIEINGFANIAAHNLGCGSLSEVKTICGDYDNVGKSSVLFNKKSCQFNQEINIVKLDDIIRQKVDFIKIDVEGYEFEVLKGASNIIDTYKPLIIFELSPKYYELIDENNLNREILEYLKLKGYKLSYLINNNILCIKDINDFLFYIKKNNFPLLYIFAK